MEFLQIVYIDNADHATKRKISNWRVLNNSSIVAFCHLRNENRTFNLSHILSASNVNTGEIYNDVYNLFDVEKPSDINVLIKTLVRDLIPSIKALKAFLCIIKPDKIGRKKYYMPISSFIREHTKNSDEYSDDELLNFINKKIFIHREEYDEYISKIPTQFITATKKTAYKIARGSGRVEVSEEILSKIEHDFK